MEYCRRHYGIRRKTLLRCGAVFGVNFPTFGVHPPFASLQCLQLTLASSHSAPGSAPLCFPRTQHHCTHPELLKTFPASSFFFFLLFFFGLGASLFGYYFWSNLKHDLDVCLTAGSLSSYKERKTHIKSLS